MLHLVVDDFIRTIRVLLEPEDAARDARTVTHDISHNPEAFGQEGPRTYFPQILRSHKRSYADISDEVLRSVVGMQEALDKIDKNVKGANDEARDAFVRAGRQARNVRPPSEAQG